MILVFWRQISSQNSNGFPPNGGLKEGVSPMTAGRRRPPQDTISSDILGTTKVQTAINHDMNQCKAVTSLFQVQFWCI